MTTAEINAEKKITADAYLQVGETMLIVDSRQPGVAVPDDQRSESLVLKVSYRYAPPDLKVDGTGIKITLRFPGTGYFACVLPWPAIYAMRAKNGDVFAWLPPEAPPVITKRRGPLGLVN
jgi:stringent starvation protein B